MESSCKNTPDNCNDMFIEQRLKYFAMTFVCELESIIAFHHSILEGTIQKSGKLPEGAMAFLGMVAGNIFGTDKVMKPLKPLLEKPFQIFEKNKSLQYHELVYGYHESEMKGRKLFVDIAVDVFISFESQLVKITSQRGPEKAIQRAAKDAAQRFLNSFKNHGTPNGEKEISGNFQKISRYFAKTFKPYFPQSKSEFELNAQKVVEGKSKSQSDIIPDIFWNPGYEIEYKCKEFHKECDKKNNDWRTSNLFGEVGVAVKRDDSDDYDVYARNISKCDKYGYRRLLPNEILNADYERTVKCERTCMHPQYLQLGDFYALKRLEILNMINDSDNAAITRRVLKFADQTKNDLACIKNKLEKIEDEHTKNIFMVIDIFNQSMDIISSGHKEILEKLANTTDEIKKICETNLEMTSSGTKNILQKIDKIIVMDRKNINDPILFRITSPVKSFEGRLEDLQKIHKALKEKSVTVISRAASIVGLGGIGKTELSKKYAQEFKAYYRNLVFINSEKSETIQNSFKELASQIGIEIYDEKGQGIHIDSVVNEIYLFLKRNGTTLMIFDNVNEYKDIKPFIFNGFSNDCICTLITSRCRNWQIGQKGDIKVIDLNKFNLDDALAYLTKYLKGEDEADLKSLNNLLDGLPLAFWQVVGYINQQNEDSGIKKSSVKFKIKDYVQLYKNQWARLLSEGYNEEDDVYDKKIATTWRITLQKFEEIGESGKLALSVLKIISYLAPDNIDAEDIFLNSEEDKEKLYEALKLLRDYSMINLDKGIVSVHRLVQRAVQIYLIELKEDEKFLKEALNLLEKSFSKDHIVSVWEHSSDYPQIVKDFYNKSKYGHQKETPMHLFASHRNDFTAMAKICEHVGDCVNCEDTYGRFPLHNATNQESMSFDVVKFLVEHGADVNCKDVFDNIPLHNAIKYGDINIVRFLVDKGADVNYKDGFNNIPLHSAIKYGDLEVIRFLVEKGADVNCKDGFNNTPLHSAIEYGDINVVRFLDEEGADVSCENLFFETPSYLAVTNGNEEIVKYLVSKRAKNIRSYTEETPFDMTVFQSHEKIVEILTKKNEENHLFYARLLNKLLRIGDIDKCKEIIQNLQTTKPECSESLLKESAALHIAVEYSNIDIIEYLLNCGMDVDTLDKFKTTPLIHAAENTGSIEVLRKLLEKGANPNTKNEKGKTVLHYLADKSYVDAIEMILCIELVDSNIRDGEDRLPFHWAAKGGNAKILQLFVDKGVDIDMPDKYGDTPLLIAASYDNSEAINYLLKLGADPNAINKKGKTVLHYFGDNNAIDAIETLLRIEAVDPNILDKGGRSPFHWAAKGGNVDILQLFIDKGVNIDMPDKNGDTPLLIAANNNNFEALKFLLKLEANPNTINKNGETALHHLAKRDSVDSIKFLLSIEAVDPNIRDKEDRSPLHWAARGGSVEILQLFIDKGVNIDMTDKYGDTPLLISAINDNFEALKYLLKLGAYPNAINKNSEAALHYLGKKDAVDAIEMLMSSEAVDPNILDKEDRSPFHWAAKGGNVDILKLFIDKGVNIDEPDKYGESPLIIAASFDNFAAMKFFFNFGANPNAKNKNGETVLHHLAKRDSVDAIKLLLSIEATDLNIRDDEGRSPFHWAAKGGNVDILKLFIDKSIDIDMIDNYGDTPLLITAINDSYEALAYLLTLGANPNAVNKNGETVLHYTARNGALYISDLLLSYEADVNIRDKDDRSPFHWAAKGGNARILQLFIDNGVDIDTLDKYGETPLFLATYHGQFEAIKYLLNNGASSTIVSKRGMTLLQKVANKCNANTLRFIEELGFELTAVDKSGKSLLHLAAHGRNEAAIKYLIEHGIEPNVTDNFGQTPLHDFPKDKRFFFSTGSIVVLIKLGANPNATSRFNRTPLHFASIKNDYLSASVLIEEGATINVCDRLGRTALHYASAKCHFLMIKFLLEKRAKVDVFDSKGRSPLHHLSRNGNFKIVKLLLKYGADSRKLDKAGHSLLHLAAVHFRYRAVDEIIRDVEGIDVNARDEKGKTPLHLAAECGRVAIVGLLVRRGADTKATEKSGKTPLDYALKFNRNKVVDFLNSDIIATQESESEMSNSN